MGIIEWENDMPETEQCPLGAENKANVQSLKEAFEDFRNEVRADIGEIQKSVLSLTNHYSKRLTWGVTATITALTSALSAAVMWIITHPVQ